MRATYTMEGCCVLFMCHVYIAKLLLQQFLGYSRLKIILYLVFQIIRVPNSIPQWGTPAFHPTQLKAKRKKLRKKNMYKPNQCFSKICISLHGSKTIYKQSEAGITSLDCF